MPEESPLNVAVGSSHCHGRATPVHHKWICHETYQPCIKRSLPSWIWFYLGHTRLFRSSARRIGQTDNKSRAHNMHMYGANIPTASPAVALHRQSDGLTHKDDHSASHIAHLQHCMFRCLSVLVLLAHCFYASRVDGTGCLDPLFFLPL